MKLAAAPRKEMDIHQMDRLQKKRKKGNRSIRVKCKDEGEKNIIGYGRCVALHKRITTIKEGREHTRIRALFDMKGRTSQRRYIYVRNKSSLSKPLIKTVGSRGNPYIRCPNSIRIQFATGLYRGAMYIFQQITYKKRGRLLRRIFFNIATVGEWLCSSLRTDQLRH